MYIIELLLLPLWICMSPTRGWRLWRERQERSDFIKQWKAGKLPEKEAMKRYLEMINRHLP